MHFFHKKLVSYTLSRQLSQQLPQRLQHNQPWDDKHNQGSAYLRQRGEFEANKIMQNTKTRVKMKRPKT